MAPRDVGILRKQPGMERRERAKIQLWPRRNIKIHSSQKIPAPNRAQALLTAAQPKLRAKSKIFFCPGLIWLRF